MVQVKTLGDLFGISHLRSPLGIDSSVKLQRSKIIVIAIAELTIHLGHIGKFVAGIDLSLGLANFKG